VKSSNENVLQFIAASFPSVWALEVLLTLRNDQRHWTQEELVLSLRASELVVCNALDALIAGGLASVEDAGAIYLPVNGEIEESIERTEQLYRTRPNRVRQTIIAASTGAAAAFADAFKLRKQADD
jgi:hypothetical protein